MRLVRRGVYSGPLILNYVAIGGGSAGLHPADMLEFARRTPDGAVLTLETLNRHIYPMNTMAIALGMHVRVGIEDTLFGPHGERMSSVQQIEMMVRMARELRREVASGAEARSIYRHRRVLGRRRRDAGAPGHAAQPRAGPARRAAAPGGLRHGTESFAMSSTTLLGRRRRIHRPRAGTPASRLYAWSVFALTFGLMLSDYLSRQVIGAVMPALKIEWALLGLAARRCW